MKKLFFTLCALCLCGTMWADDDDTYRPTNESEIYVDQSTGLSFYVNTDENAVITYEVLSEENYANHDFSNFTIPQTVQADGGSQYSVVEVGGFAFNNCTGIEGELVIPDYINTLGWAAFQNCTKITKVTFDYSSTHLASRCNTTSNYVFAGCESTIKEVEMNRDIELGHSTAACSPFLYQQAITTVTFGQHVDGIPNHFFRDTHNNKSITSVTCYNTYPPSVNSSYDPFYQALSSNCVLYVPEGYIETYQSDSYWGVNFTNIQAIEGYTPEVEQPDGTLMDVDTHLFFEINETTGVVSIIADPVETYTDTHLVYVEDGDYYTFPETVTDKSGVGGSVTRIEANAFENSGISGHLYIPAFITAIGAEAFKNSTHITEVTYEYSDVALSDESSGNNTNTESFYGCSGVTIVNLYRNIEAGHSSNICTPFAYHTAISTINIGPRVTEIPHHMFNTNSNSYSLTTINCYAVNPPALGTAAFRAQYLNNGFVVNVPFGAEEAYLSDDDWTSMFVYEASGYTLAGHIAEMSNAFAITTHENNDGTAYATFYNGAANVELFNGTLTAYEATTLEDEGLVIDIVEIGNVIPASTGVVVETGEAGTYLAIATTAEANSASENNHLYGFDTAETTVGPDGGSYYFYLLSSYNDVVGFYYGAEGGAAFECQAHRAYLAIEQGSGSQGISIRKGSGEDTTGISSVESATEGASVKGIYTIQGVRVSNMNQPGLYIVDGKKVLVK